MSGKTLKPGWLAYRLVIWSVALAILLGACGNEATSTPVPAPTTVSGPTATPTIAFTSTPVPTPTPTEIPIVLPTATPPNPNLPPTAAIYQPAFTQAPTYTPVPTDRPYPTDLPAPTVTPYAAPFVIPFSIYQKPLISVYNRLDYVLPPAFTTQCINAKYFTNPVQFEPGDPTNLIALAPENQWVQDFSTRWFTDQRLNSFRLPAPTFTPYPTNTPIPTWTPVPSPTPLPYNTPDVFTGLTAAPPVPPTDTIGPTSTPYPTATPIVPTWTPSLVQRFQTTGSLTGNFIQSIYISDVTAAMNKFSTQPINFVVMWQVMNDMTLALVNVDTPIEVYLRAYESYLDQTIQTILNRSLNDPRLDTTGSERYANRKIIIGNVPDLRAFSFFTPCFTREKLQQVQNSYNAIIARAAEKYAGRVYVADMTTINWQGNPQWVAVEDGYDLTYAGSDAVADVFGKVFLSLKL